MQLVLKEMGADGSAPAPLSAYSVVHEWGLAHTSGGDNDMSPIEHFEKRVQDAMKEVCRKFGGPRRYLQELYDTDSKKLAFARRLLHEFPMQGDGRQLETNIPT